MARICAWFGAAVRNLAGMVFSASAVHIISTVKTIEGKRTSQEIKGLLVLLVLYTNLLMITPCIAQEIRTFSGHTRAVYSVAFSPDGRYALSGSVDRTVKLWDVSTGREVRTFSGHTGEVYSVAFSPDGRYALSGSADKTVKQWDVSTGREVFTFEGHTSDVTSVAFSPNNDAVLSGSADRTVNLWFLPGGRGYRPFSGHTAGVTSVTFSPNGRYILSSSKDKTVKLWDVSGPEIRTFSGHTDQVYSVTFSPNGLNALSSSDDRTLKLWNVSTGREIRTFSGYSPLVLSVAFSPDGQYVVTGSADTARPPRNVRVWDVSTWQEIGAFSGHVNRVYSVAFSRDGRYILSGSDDNTLKLWQMPQPRTEITVTSPNGEENWPIGTNQTITWTSSSNAGENVRIEISRDGGSSWSTITSSTPNDGSYVWQVTSPATAEAKIRITSTSTSASDVSDRNFLILSSTITVTSPNGGENWPIGTNQTITWTSSSNAGENVRIEISRDGGSSWSTITSSTPNDGSYVWQVTSPTTAEAKIRITSTFISSVSDVSNGNFRILSEPVPSTIEISSNNWVISQGNSLLITGRVLSDTGVPVANVPIHVEDPIRLGSFQNVSTTNQDGRFSYSISTTSSTPAQYYTFVFFAGSTPKARSTVIVAVAPISQPDIVLTGYDIPLGVLGINPLSSDATLLCRRIPNSSILSETLEKRNNAAEKVTSSFADYGLDYLKAVITDPSFYAGVIGTATCFAPTGVTQLISCPVGIKMLGGSLLKNAVVQGAHNVIDVLPVDKDEKAKLHTAATAGGFMMSVVTFSPDGGVIQTLGSIGSASRATHKVITDAHGNYERIILAGSNETETQAFVLWKITEGSWKTVSRSISSPHPYSDNYNNTWTITHPGAQRIKVHFSAFDTETNWDFVYIYDGNDKQIAKYDGNKGAFWSEEVPGNTVKIRLTTDGSVTRQGFDIDQYSYSESGDSDWQTVTRSISSPHPYTDNYNNMWTTTHPDAKRMKVHFSSFETEKNFDYVYIYDGNDKQIAKYDGNKGAFWSEEVPGNTVKIRLTTDGSVTKYGFDIDQYSYSVTASGGGSSERSVTRTVSGQITTSSNQFGSPSRYYNLHSVVLSAGQTLSLEVTSASAISFEGL